MFPRRADPHPDLRGEETAFPSVNPGDPQAANGQRTVSCYQSLILLTRWRAALKPQSVETG
jgi:hypothetical protein